MKDAKKGRLHLPIRASSLDAGYYCGMAVKLAREAPRQQTEYTLTGNAFDSGLEFIAGGSTDADTYERHRRYMTQLSPDEQTQIDGEIDSVCKSLQPLNKAKLRLKAQEKWALDGEGLACDYDDLPRAVTRGRSDWCWQSDDGVVDVVDFKRGFGPFPAPQDSLQVGAAAIAAIQARDCEKARLWIAHMPPDGIARFANTEPMDLDQLDGIWRRVKVAVERDPDEANVGPHCSTCYQQGRCPAWLLPAIDTADRDDTLAPLWSGKEESPEAVAELRQTLEALGEIVERGRVYVKAWVTKNGPLVRGEQELRLSAVPGRESTSVEALKRTGLYEKAKELGAVKFGGTSMQLRWGKNRRLIGDKKATKLAVLEGGSGEGDDTEGEGGKSAA